LKCFYCKGSLIAGTTAHVVNFNKSIIVIKDVPCDKCKQCNETVYSGTIVKQLERIVNSLKGSFAEVVVANYSDKVA